MEVAQPTNLMSHVQAKHPEEHKRMSSVAESNNARQTTLTGGIFLTLFHPLGTTWSPPPIQ